MGLGAEVSRRILSRMSTLGYSGVDIADMCAVSPASVHNWTAKEVVPRGQNLVTLSRVLQCSEHWLINGGDEIMADTYRPVSVDCKQIDLATGETITREIHEDDIGPPEFEYLVAFCVDNSMPTSAPQHTRCIFQVDDKVSEEEIHLVRIKKDGRLLVRRCFSEGKSIRMIAESKNYEPITILSKSVDVLGVLINSTIYYRYHTYAKL